MKTFRPWVIFLLFCAAITASIFIVSKFAVTAPIIVSGSIGIKPELRKQASHHSHLFIVLFDQDSKMPMPYAAARYKLHSAPSSNENFFSFFLTEQNTQVMNPGIPKPKRLRVKIRLDQDGIAGPDQPGDLTGEKLNVAWGTKDIKIRINHSKNF